MTNINDIEDFKKMQVNAEEPRSIVTTTTITGSIARTSVDVSAVDNSVLHLWTVAEDQNERKADLCCGICCDFLRACIIVNILYLVACVLTLLFSWLFISVVNDEIEQIEGSEDNEDESEEYITDDEQEKKMEESIYMKALLDFNVMVTIFGTLSAVIGIIGAAKFNKYMVLFTGICYCILVIPNCWLYNWPVAFLNGFFAYPHFALFMALNSNKITRGGYMIESHCCCDVKIDTDV